MILADIIAIILVALFCLLGLWLGLSKGLVLFTRGIFGLIISIFFCYTFGGLILGIEPVGNFVMDLHNSMEAKGGFLGFLAMIRTEIIVYYIALFIVVTLLRVLVVRLIKNILEIDNVVFKVINKVTGVIFFLAMLVLLWLVAFQIIYALEGAGLVSFGANLKGSFFALDKVYENNPLIAFIKIIKLEYVIRA